MFFFRWSRSFKNNYIKLPCARATFYFCQNMTTDDIRKILQFANYFMSYYLMWLSFGDRLSATSSLVCEIEILLGISERSFSKLDRIRHANFFYTAIHFLPSQRIFPVWYSSSFYSTNIRDVIFVSLSIGRAHKDYTGYTESFKCSAKF